MSRNCLECVYCSIDWGCRGFSEWTPGYPGHAYCGKGRWPMEGRNSQPGSNNCDNPDKRAFCEAAVDCPDYKPEDWVKRSPDHD